MPRNKNKTINSGGGIQLYMAKGFHAVFPSFGLGVFFFFLSPPSLCFFLGVSVPPPLPSSCELSALSVMLPGSPFSLSSFFFLFFSFFSPSPSFSLCFFFSFFSSFPAASGSFARSAFGRLPCLPLLSCLFVFLALSSWCLRYRVCPLHRPVLRMD